MLEEQEDSQTEVLPPLPKGYEPVKKQSSTLPPLPSGYEPVKPKAVEPAPVYRGIANSLPTMNVGKSSGDIASLPQVQAKPLGDTELQGKMKVREEDRQAAIKNYVTKKGIKENTPQYNKEVENVNKQLLDDNLTVSTNKNGEKQLFRTENFGQTLLNTLKSSVKSSVDAVKENNASDAELLEIYKQKDAEPDSETRPSGVSGYFGELAGGIVKPIALQSLNAIMPTLGTGAMVAEAYNTSRANQTYQLYREGVKQGLKPEEALAKAKNTAQYSALGDAASMYALSGALGSVENKAVEAATKTFKQSLKDGAKGVLKVGGIIGAAEGSKVPIEAAGGYDRTVTEGIEKTLEGVGSGIMMDLAFKTAAHAITNPLGVPKAMFAAAKNLISEAPKEIVDAHIEAMPEEVGKQVKESIDNFQKAKEKVDGFVPEDDVAWFAGKMEKADNHEKEIVKLELSKVGKPKFVQDQIDAQIQEIRGKVDEINNEVDKVYRSGKKPVEKDDVTGLKLGEEPSVTVIKPEENQPIETIGIGGIENKPETNKSGVSVILPNQNKKPEIVENKKVEILNPTEVEKPTTETVSEVIGEPKEKEGELKAEVKEFDGKNPFIPKGQKSDTPNATEYKLANGDILNVGDYVNDQSGKSLGRITGFDGKFAFTEIGNKSNDPSPSNANSLKKYEKVKLRDSGFGGKLKNAIPESQMKDVSIMDISELNKIRTQPKKGEGIMGQDPNAESVSTMGIEGIKKPLIVERKEKIDGTYTYKLDNGHNRLEEAEKLGATKMPVIIKENGKVVVEKSIMEIETPKEQVKPIESKPTKEGKQPTPISEGEIIETPSSRTSGEEVKGESQPIEPPKPPKPPKEVKVESESEDIIGITHEETDKVAREFGLPEYEKNPETVEEWDIQADKRIREEKNAIPNLLDKMKKGDTPSEVEQRMMLKYLASLKAKLSADPLNNELLSKLKEAKELSDIIGGREVAKSLRARQGLTPVEDTVGDAMVRTMESLNVDTLTDKQKKDIIAEHEKIAKAKEESDAKIKILEDEVAKLKVEGIFNKTKGTSNKKSKQDIVKERNDIKQSIKDKWKKASEDGTLTAVPVPYAKQLAAVAPDVVKLMRSYAEEGIGTLDEVVKKIVEDIKDFIPEITEKDVNNIIAGNYNEKRKTRNELAAKIKDFRDEAALIDKLDTLLTTNEPKEEKKKIERNQQITELRKKIGDYKKEEAKANKFYGEKDTINRKIEKMEDELQRLKERKDKEPSTTVKRELTEKEKELQEKITAERKLIKKEEAEAKKFYAEEIPLELKQLRSYKEKLKKQQKDVQGKIDRGEFAPDIQKVSLLDNPELKKKFPKEYKEALEAKDKLNKLKLDREVAFLKQQYENRSASKKAWDGVLEVLNVPRTIMSSMDFSAPLRQGVVPSLTHPFVAAKAFKTMFQHAFSQKSFDRWFMDLRESELFKVMDKSGLYVADPHDLRLSAKEEAFMNNLAEKIPLGVGKAIKGSERAYVSYLNKMRVDLFKQGMDAFLAEGKTPENSPELYKGWASWVNNSTGRGGLGKAETAAPILASVFFSPRLIASRVNLLNPLYYKSLPKEVRIAALTDMIKFIALGATVLTLSHIGGASTQLDPRSSDFGKIKVGDTRYDIWGGFGQYIRVLSQILTRQSISAQTGKLQDLSGKGAFGKTPASVGISFVRGKLAPVPSMAWDFASGRTAIGEKVTWQQEAKSHLLPLIYSDLQEAYKQQGVKSLLTVGLPSTFGIGVQTYKPKETKKQITINPKQ